MLLVGRSVVSSISVSSLKPIVETIIKVLMDDGRPIGIKTARKERIWLNVSWGERELVLKGALHQPKILVITYH